MERTTPSGNGTRTAGRDLQDGHLNRLLDYDAAAPILGCSPRMVRKLVETRQIASVKIGALVRIEPDALWQYVQRHRREAVE